MAPLCSTLAPHFEVSPLADTVAWIELLAICCGAPTMAGQSSKTSRIKLFTVVCGGTLMPARWACSESNDIVCRVNILLWTAVFRVLWYVVTRRALARVLARLRLSAAVVGSKSFRRHTDRAVGALVFERSCFGIDFHANVGLWLRLKLVLLTGSRLQARDPDCAHVRVLRPC